MAVPRAHVERLEAGTDAKLGVFLPNKTRRTKLTVEKLAALGPQWAA
ncbi:hypothetical protein ACFV0T_40230 [Streptomyces sp. NPDC059582]